MSAGPQFQILVEDVRILKQSIREGARINLRNKLKQVEAIAASAEKDGNKTWYWPLGIAASIVLIVAAILWWPTADGNKSLALFDEAFEPYPNIVMPVERGVSRDSTGLASSFREYESGNYGAAIRLFESEPTKDGSVYFFLGISYLALGESQAARLNLEKASQEADRSFDEQIQWYEALSYLRAKDRGNAIKSLEIIIKGDNSYTEKANNLLMKLKSIE